MATRAVKVSNDHSPPTAEERPRLKVRQNSLPPRQHSMPDSSTKNAIALMEARTRQYLTISIGVVGGLVLLGAAGVSIWRNDFRPLVGVWSVIAVPLGSMLTYYYRRRSGS